MADELDSVLSELAGETDDTASSDTLPDFDNPEFVSQVFTNIAIDTIVDEGAQQGVDLTIPPPSYDGGSRGEFKLATEAWAASQKQQFSEVSPELYQQNRDAIDAMLDEAADGHFRDKTSVENNWIVDKGKRVARGVYDTMADVWGAVIRTPAAITEGAASVVDIIPGTEDLTARMRSGAERVTEFSEDAVEGLQDFADMALPSDTSRDEDLSSQIATGVGQGVTQLAAAAISTPVMVGTLAAQVESQAQESYDRVMQLTGGNKQKASEAYRKTLVGSGISNIPEYLLFKKLGAKVSEASQGNLTGKLGQAMRGDIKLSTGQFGKELIKSTGKATLGAGITEGIQEGIETSSQQAAIESTLSDGEIGFLERTFSGLTDEQTLRAGLVGAGTGAILGGAVETTVANSLRNTYSNIVANRPTKPEILEKNPELENYTPKDLADSQRVIQELETELDNTNDPEFKKTLQGLIKDQKSLNENIVTDLNKQGIEAESVVKQEAQAEIDTLLQERDSLQSQRQELVDKDLANQKTLGNIDTRIAELNKEAETIKAQRIDTREDVAQTKLAQVEAKQEGDIEQAQQLGQKLELDRAKGQIESAQSARSLSDVQSEVRTLKAEKKDVLKGRKATAEQLQSTTKQAQDLATKLQSASDKKNAFDVVAAGDSRIVASRNVDKDAVDFAGNILAGFGISKPVSIVTNQDATTKGIKELFSKEGAPTGKVLKKEGEAVPSFSQLDNSFAIKLNEGKLTPRNAESIAHEVGHVVTEDLVSRNPEIVPALDKAYQSFISSGKDLDTLAGEQVLPQRKAGAGRVTNKKAVSQKEWMADNVARYVQNRALKADGPVQKFFKDIATALRSIYNNLTGQSELQIDKTIEGFLDEHFREDRATAFLSNRQQDVPPTPPTDTPTTRPTTDRPSTGTTRDVPQRQVEPQIRDTTARRVEGVTSFGSAGLSDAQLNDPAFDVLVPQSARLSKNKLFESLTEKDIEGDASIKKILKENAKSRLPVISAKARINELKAVTEQRGVQDMFNLFVNATPNKMNTETQVALGSVLYEAVQNSIKQAKAVNNINAVRKLERDALQIYKKGEELARESGRQVQLFRYWRSEPTAADIVDKVREFNEKNLEELGLDKKKLTPETEADIQTLAEELLNIDERASTLQKKKFQQIVDRIVSQEGADWGDTLLNYYRANILFNPDSLSANVLYSAQNALFKLAAGRLAATLRGDLPFTLYSKHLAQAGNQNAVLRTKQALRGDDVEFGEDIGLKYDIVNPKDLSISAKQQLQNLVDEGVSKASPRYAAAATKAMLEQFSDFIRNVMVAGDSYVSSNTQEAALRYAEASEIYKSDKSISPEDLAAKVAERLWLTDAQTQQLYSQAETQVTNFFGGREAVNELRSTAKGEKQYLAEIDNTYLDLLEANRPEEANASAEQFARQATLTTRPVGIPALMSNTISGFAKVPIAGKGVRFFIPFVNTIANLGGFMGDIYFGGLVRGYTGYNTILPAKAFNKEGYSPVFGTRKPIGEFDKQATMGLTALAWASTAALVGLAGEDDEDAFFDITGFVSNDFEERQLLNKTRGLEPYTLKIGDFVFDYSESPLLLLLGTAASARDLYRFPSDKFNEKATSDKIAYLAGLSTSLMADATFVGESLKFFSNIFNGLDQAAIGDRSGFERIFEQAGKNLASAVPVAGGGMKRLVDDIMGAESVSMRELRKNPDGTKKGSIEAGLQYGLLFGTGTEKYPYRDWFGDANKKSTYERLAIGVRRFVRPVEKAPKHWEIVRDRGINLIKHQSNIKFLKSVYDPEKANSRVHNINEISSGAMTPEESDYFLKNYGSRMKKVVIDEIANSRLTGDKLQKFFDKRRSQIKLEVQKEILKKFRAF